jgi:DNA-binding NtrC family response regulator
MPAPHPATLAPDDLLGECDFRTTRRSGPGGQHRNKVETAVILTHRPTGIAAEASERRSQGANRAVALQRLRTRLAIEFRSSAADEPSPLWQRRTTSGKLAVNPDHADFPALLAEALDVLAAHNYEVAEAAARLGISRTQLVNLLRLAPDALAHLNSERQNRGAGPLK